MHIHARGAYFLFWFWGHTLCSQGYSWLCTQRSLLAALRGLCGMLGIVSRLTVCKANATPPQLLYYCSGPWRCVSEEGLSASLGQAPPRHLPLDILIRLVRHSSASRCITPHLCTWPRAPSKCSEASDLNQDLETRHLALDHLPRHGSWGPEICSHTPKREVGMAREALC